MTLEKRGIRALGALGLAYAVLASFTRPFTWEADVVTAVPLAVAGAGCNNDWQTWGIGSARNGT